MKMICYYCSETTTCSCPDDAHHKHSDAKFICDICVRLMEEGVPEAELRNHARRKEMADMIKAEEEGDELAEKYIAEFFDDVWAESKITAKSLSKKELAEYFYGIGMSTAFVLMLAAAKAEKNHEQNSESKS